MCVTMIYIICVLIFLFRTQPTWHLDNCNLDESWNMCCRVLFCCAIRPMRRKPAICHQDRAGIPMLVKRIPAQCRGWVCVILSVQISKRLFCDLSWIQRISVGRTKNLDWRKIYVNINNLLRTCNSDPLRSLVSLTLPPRPLGYRCAAFGGFFSKTRLRDPAVQTAIFKKSQILSTRSTLLARLGKAGSVTGATVYKIGDNITEHTSSLVQRMEETVQCGSNIRWSGWPHWESLWQGAKVVWKKCLQIRRNMARFNRF